MLEVGTLALRLNPSQMRLQPCKRRLAVPGFLNLQKIWASFDVQRLDVPRQWQEPSTSYRQIEIAIPSFRSTLRSVKASSGQKCRDWPRSRVVAGTVVGADGRTSSCNVALRT